MQQLPVVGARKSFGGLESHFAASGFSRDAEHGATPRTGERIHLQPTG